MYNNYFVSDTTNGEYAYAYSLGVGNSQIYAESNVADIVGKDYTSFVKVFGANNLQLLIICLMEKLLIHLMIR